MCKKCAYPLKETKDISVSVRIHKFGRQTAGGGDSGYDDFQEGTSSGYGGFSGYGGNYGGDYGAHNHDNEDEDEDDGSEDDDEDDDEDEDEDGEAEYGDGQSLGMAALNIKEFKIEGGGSSNKGKSSK